MSKLKHFYDQVKTMLTEKPELRDSDARLQHRLWKSQGIDLNNENQFVRFAISGETIRRTRQKIQEKNPSLRSSKKVQDLKNDKEKMRGTFIYQETLV